MSLMAVMNQRNKVDDWYTLKPKSGRIQSHRRSQKHKDKASDPYVAKIEGADDIWKSVIANEEVVKRQEVGLAKVGYKKGE